MANQAPAEMGAPISAMCEADTELGPAEQAGQQSRRKSDVKRSTMCIM